MASSDIATVNGAGAPDENVKTEESQSDTETAEGTETTEESVYSGIVIDGNFTDWNTIAKTQYIDAALPESAAALYSDGDYLFGYVDYYAAYYNDQFNQIYMTINDGVNKKWYEHDDSSRVMFTLRSVDAAGNVNRNSQATNLGEGDYEFHIYDNAHAGYNNAKKNDLHSIGFLLISAGIFGSPVDQAWRQAIQACNDFINANADCDIDIVFAVLDDSIMEVGLATLNEIY